VTRDGNTLRHQCEREKQALAQQGADNERGLAEQARYIKLLEARVVRLEIELQNVTHWLRQEHEEKTAYARIRRAIRRLGGLGL
jgi:hypothetical protein